MIFSEILIFRRDLTNTIELNEFNQTFFEQHLKSHSSNEILLLIANNENDPCISYFHQQISLIKE